MRFPNIRYGHPEAMKFYAQGIPIDKLARILRRSERSIKNWLLGRYKVPWWVPEILRLQHIENIEQWHVGCSHVHNCPRARHAQSSHNLERKS